MVGSCTFFQVISFTFIHVFTNWRISRSFQGAKGYNLKLPAPTSQNCHKTYDLLRLIRSNKDPHQAMQAIVINYSKKTPNRWWLRTYSSKNTPGIFNFFFTPGNSRENKTPPLENPQNCVTCPWNPKARNQNPWNFHIIFSWSPLEIPLRF